MSRCLLLWVVCLLLWAVGYSCWSHDNGSQIRGVGPLGAGTGIIVRYLARPPRYSGGGASGGGGRGKSPLAPKADVSRVFFLVVWAKIKLTLLASSSSSYFELLLLFSGSPVIQKDLFLDDLF